MEVVYRARYVFPVDRPPIEDGTVAIDSGLIRATGRFPGDFNAIDLGDVAIIPGLVNAHTHLEFSDLDQPLGKPGMSLPWWIRELIERRGESVDSADAAWRKGLAESYRCGVTTIGEIATSTRGHIASSDNVATYLELRAFRRDGVEQCIAEATTFCEGRGAGLSPHAPYTVHQELFQGAVGLAVEYKKALAMHLAESREELQFLETSRGPFRDLLEERDWWEADAIRMGSRPLEYLQGLSRAPRSLVIHGNYLNEEEIRFAAEHRERMAIVYCPRTHAYFGHELYPLGDMLDNGARVALGTDSRASNPDLDLRQEMRFVMEKHGIAPEQALRLGTIEGAATLGLDHACGTITNGKCANLAIVQLPNRRAADPHELLFDPEAGVVATLCRGRVVFSEHPGIRQDM